MIPTLLIVSVIIFGLMRVLPGDVATMILIGPTGDGQPAPEAVAALNEQLGLNRPIPVQYLSWMWDVVRFDGDSLSSRRPIFSEVTQRLPVTLQLGVMASVISLAIAIPLGTIAAVKRGTWLDYAARIFALGGLSIPNFWVGMLIILALVTYLGWTPAVTYVGLLDDPWTNIQQLIFPALALGYQQAGLVSRLIRSSLLEVMNEDYVRTARSKGLNERTIILRHALRNSLLPVITVVGVGLAGIVGGTVIIETVFTLPGLGRLLRDAINQRDYPVVQTLVFMFAIVFAMMSLIVDLAYSVLDPRIRLT